LFNTEHVGSFMLYLRTCLHTSPVIHIKFKVIKQNYLNKNLINF